MNKNLEQQIKELQKRNDVLNNYVIEKDNKLSKLESELKCERDCCKVNRNLKAVIDKINDYWILPHCNDYDIVRSDIQEILKKWNDKNE